MSKITYQFALIYYELASLLFQRQSILCSTINLYAIMFFPHLVSYIINIIFSSLLDSDWLKSVPINP